MPTTDGAAADDGDRWDRPRECRDDDDAWPPGLISRPLAPECGRLVFLPRREERELERVYSQASWPAMQRSQPFLSPLHLSYRRCQEVGLTRMEFQPWWTRDGM